MQTLNRVVNIIALVFTSMLVIGCGKVIQDEDVQLQNPATPSVGGFNLFSGGLQFLAGTQSGSTTFVLKNAGGNYTSGIASSSSFQLKGAIVVR